MLGFGCKDRVEISNRLYLTELEKFMMSPVQTNGGTFRQNLTLLIKEPEEPLSKSWQRTIVGDMDPHFYNVKKMSGQKRNLEKRQKLTRWLSRRNEDSLR